MGQSCSEPVVSCNYGRDSKGNCNTNRAPVLWTDIEEETKSSICGSGEACLDGCVYNLSNNNNLNNCSTTGNGANAATVTCTSCTDQVATTCNAGYGLVGSACVACDASTFAIQGNSAECQTCATIGNGVNAATITCTDSFNQIATTCNAGYGLVGDACVVCDDFTYAVQGNSAECQTCATIGNGVNAATITCTSGTNQVATTCNAGYGLVGNACVACAASTYASQGNNAACQTCASGSYTDTGTGTTGTTCSTCATSGNGANAATVTCTDGFNQIATTCDAGYGLVGDACVACDDFTYAVQGNSAECQTCATIGNGANAATITCNSGTDQIATTCNAGYGLVGDACVACAPSSFAIQGNNAACQTCASGSYTDTGTGTTGTTCTPCATVSKSSARTCNAGGASGIQTVTCNTGFHESGSSGNNLGCTACTNQTNCATSTANQCSTSSGFTTKTPCTSVTAGYYLDKDVVKQCHTVPKSSARTCNAGGASGIQTVTCNTGFHESGSSGNNLGCTAYSGRRGRQNVEQAWGVYDRVTSTSVSEQACPIWVPEGTELLSPSVITSNNSYCRDSTKPIWVPMGSELLVPSDITSNNSYCRDSTKPIWVQKKK